MHDTALILTLTAALSAGLVFGYAAHMLRLSPIIGYLFAGVVLGPFTPGYVADQHLAEQLAEVGVMLLMFGVGLHFHFEDLLAVRKVAIPGAIAQIFAATVLGVLVAILFGWGWEAGLIYGLALSVASTVVLTRVLVDNRQLHTQAGRISVGWLVVEDLFTVIVLVLLPILFAPDAAVSANAPGASLGVAFAILALKLCGLVAVTWLLGQRGIPWIFTRAARTSSQELFTLTVLVTALGIAVLSATVFGVSMALGAFLAGMVVGKSEFSLRAASEVLPLRDAFAVLFFVSVGMLLDPSIFVHNLPLVLATVAVVLVGKTLAAFVLVILFGYPVRIALPVSVALAQIGEFSFILASLGKHLHLLSDLAMNALVATAIISITLNPILFRCIPRIESWMQRRPWIAKLLAPRSIGGVDEAQIGGPSSGERAVIVGHGPIGTKVRTLLKANGIDSSIVELNLDTVRKLQAEGITAVYGDAAKAETLEGAGIRDALTLILTSSSISTPEEIVRQAKQLNPTINIIARTAYAHEVGQLKNAGCEAVVSGEGEVAIALIEVVLRKLGATPEQIVRERRRVREELVT